jgi:hypothetical protein
VATTGEKYLATTGDNNWPYSGRNQWPLTLDTVTPVAFALGVVVSTSGDGRTIRAVEDINGRRHPATRYTYRIPTRYTCAMQAVLRAATPGPNTVDEVRRIVSGMVARPDYRAAVIAHDLDRSCECVTRGWR